MTEAKYDEMVEIAKHIRAHIICIDGRTVEEAQRAKELGVNMFVPVTSPAGLSKGAQGFADVLTVGAGANNRSGKTSLEDHGLLVCYENQEPKPGSYLPPGSVIPEGWYFYRLNKNVGGFEGTEFHKLVETSMQGNWDARVMRLDFAEVDHTEASQRIALELGAKAYAAVQTDTKRGMVQSAGSGVSRSKSYVYERKVHFKFTIGLFDRAVYEKLVRISRKKQVDQNNEIRRSSGRIATLRWNNFRVQPLSRRDLIEAGAIAIPSSESNQYLGKRCYCFGEYVCGVLSNHGENYIHIPITMYGLAGSGKSSVLGTWYSSTLDSPYTFVEKTCVRYHQRVTNPTDRAYVEDTIMSEISFDASKYGSEAEGIKMSKDWEKGIKLAGTAKLIFEDTAPAVSPTTDVRGKSLPEGLKVLVMNANEVDNATDASKWKDLVIEDGGYPPIACILAHTNEFPGDRVTELIQWVQDNLSVKHVIPTRTFKVLTEKKRLEYQEAGPGSILRKEFDKDWLKTRDSAQESLLQLVRIIESDEVARIEMVLDDGKRKVMDSTNNWFPFTFTSSKDTKDKNA